MENRIWREILMVDAQTMYSFFRLMIDNSNYEGDCTLHYAERIQDEKLMRKLSYAAQAYNFDYMLDFEDNDDTGIPVLHINIESLNNKMEEIYYRDFLSASNADFGKVLFLIFFDNSKRVEKIRLYHSINLFLIGEDSIETARKVIKDMTENNLHLVEIRDDFLILQNGKALFKFNYKHLNWKGIDVAGWGDEEEEEECEKGEIENE